MQRDMQASKTRVNRNDGMERTHDSSYVHEPVLVEEVLQLLNMREKGVYVDGTVGGGGHSLRLATALGAGGRLFGLDRDPDAVSRASRRLHDAGREATIVTGNFAELKKHAAAWGVTSFDGILLDLGISSDQLNTPERGFSFQQSGPLDMRMDPLSGSTAADIVNQASEAELAHIFREFGEELQAKRIAHAIVRRREKSPITRTDELAAIVESVVPRRGDRIHPATRVFQALRIEVNQELDSLEQALVDGLSLLSPGGRMAVISFHSLEDRRVKHQFVAHAGRMESLQEGGRRWVGTEPAVQLITKKPVTASDDEISRNPRSRSAKLRVAERLSMTS